VNFFGGNMSVIAHEGSNSFHFGARAVLLSDNYEIETASDWASQHVKKNGAYSWILGSFVEAERPNNNKQFFSTAGLQMGKPSIMHAPLNINHNQNRVVGTFVASELLFPKDAEAASTQLPQIESLAVMWRYYYPDAYQMVQAAHQENSLFFSMECVPRAISSIGGVDDSKEYKYEGRVSKNYPDDINERAVDGIHLIDPHFVGGALVIPPERPGWSKAEVKQVSTLMKDQWREMESVCAAVRETSPELADSKVEWVAAALFKQGLNASPIVQAENRNSLAKAGFAMPDGSFPVLNVDDLKTAIEFIDKAKDPEETKKFVESRAIKLGSKDLIPDNWFKN
jgi:hypothetical protein